MSEKHVRLEKNGRKLNMFIYSEGKVSSLYEETFDNPEYKAIGQVPYSDLKGVKDFLTSLDNPTAIEGIMDTVSCIFSSPMCWGNKRLISFRVFEDKSFSYSETLGGDSVTLCLNEKGQIVEKTINRHVESFIYDDRGNITFQKEQCKNGYITFKNMFYDKRNRLIFEGRSDGKWSAWVYNEDGTVDYYDESGDVETIHNCPGHN
jgi:hypothetical protein